MTETPRPPQYVAILGGGYAGMAAAVELARAGVPVTVFEAGPQLGGRARGVEIDGQVLDNGQHMLVGAYSELLRLMALVGLREADGLIRQPLDLDVIGPSGRAFRMRCPQLPAPFHTLFGLLQAEGLTWADRWAAIRTMSAARWRNWRMRGDMSVADWLAAERQPEILIRCLWEPLTLAALNTPIAEASAKILLNVLRDSLAGDRAASDFLLPKIDLTSLFPAPAARYVADRGGQVLTGTMVRRMVQHDTHWQIDDHPGRFSHVIVALPPHRLGMLEGAPRILGPIARMMADWTYQPIYTVYLQYPATTRLPKPMLGMVETATQWVFDRGALCGQDGLFAAVISAAGPHQTVSQADLAAQVTREIAAAFPALPAPISHRVIAEKRATFACTPYLVRHSNATCDASCWLAGDYTAGDYPATLEGAVRSGVAAAQRLMAGR
jgi:squalene-associated FAD-dependent desaturase